jgi:hypothetical protein
MTRTQRTRLDLKDQARIAGLRAKLRALHDESQRVREQIGILDARIRRRAERARWTPPNNPTAPAKQVWRALFPGEPWPEGWRVRWVGFMRGASGFCSYAEREIRLSHGDFNGSRGKPVLATLIHEFVHLRSGPDLRMPGAGGRHS